MEHPPRFNPKQHLAARNPPKVLLMEELGYEEHTGISPVAVSEPFQLFTPEAIQIMRSEIQNPNIHAEHRFSSNIAASQLRGYAKK